MVNGKCTCHDGSKYNKGECKKIGKYKGGKRVKKIDVFVIKEIN